MMIEAMMIEKYTPAVLNLRDFRFSHGVTGYYVVPTGKFIDVSKHLSPFNVRVKPSQKIRNAHTWQDSYECTWHMGTSLML